MIRIGPTLEELGITSKPEATLSREDAFFVLVDDLLIYRDARILRRVSLRDLTRIHSDDSGTLRVETPAGTALSASLLGFDPDEVQPFFLRVRDATAYAKAQARRAQDRERGEAAPSPFARVPRAQPTEAPSPAPVSAPVVQADMPPAAPPAEEFEPYAPYEQPRTLAGRLGSVVRVIKRRPEAPQQSGPDGHTPGLEESLSGPQPVPEPAPRQPTLQQIAPQPSPAQAPSSPGAAPAPGSGSGTGHPGVGGLGAAGRPEAVAPVPVQPASAQPVTVQPAPARPSTAPPSSARPSPVQAERPASVSMDEALRPMPAAVEDAPGSERPSSGPVPAPDPAPDPDPAPADRHSGAGGLLARLNPAGTPDLRVWPPRLRLVAGLLVLTALVLTGYYLLNGAVAAGLWLLAAGVAGGVFLLAAADVVQVLAAQLGAATPPQPGAAGEHGET
ncbi:hypothetical protein Deipr_1647 [Deinococcus proteolyticus MRP]|uniref:Uncharacterized protein n=1 Tax=Deinococcus proteolyticus (strain ATCC 35074 / DSM 20540 / JCM 6276 / NBRC 101906 / NCIMB 13154 / VKM Ac-1939 / CCM 2703 / MRP) TaxID=693977 RepID=F0RKS3_DEIPM|nr:hypothetical protein [Deinococcus proteolyticus]ADY26785.1 hypothetical protein Deipr_1647 [Deinococcus proteolyticus MRP]